MSRWPVLVAVALLLTGCSSAIDGKAFREGSAPGASDTKFPRYTPPADGSGFSDQVLDQPLALPVKQGEEGCDWLESIKPDLQPLGLVSTKGVLSGCQFVFPNNKGAQVHAYSPYSWITQDSPVMEPVEIAGIKGRTYAFDPEPATFCSVNMDVRAYASIAVDAYDVDSDEGGTRAEHCELAKKVAEVVLKKFVPLAGGKPAPSTVQEPPAEALKNADICEVVKFTHANYAGVNAGREGAQKGEGPLGPTCTHEVAYAKAVGMYTNGTGGLEAVPPKAGAEVRNGQFGTLKARFEQTAESCALSVQLSNGQVVQVDFIGKKKEAMPRTCVSAQLILSVSMLALITGDS
ncbi:hypothetical protein ACFORH_04330 [Amycolatopsis roodepoortensis]|uniref:Uncharacterized protein YceK n=1 Tax=Amycolatopsis roodepoortensis TaxID=700274 RepID=A0ABR9L6I0_9PSEU|nr:hypothetical protein [Amycolatopsis roodepoortensis]MBE1576230.1 uncharacterized protein YceK [Amycolatopsis roodepoortensis]